MTYEISKNGKSVTFDVDKKEDISFDTIRTIYYEMKSKSPNNIKTVNGLIKTFEKTHPDCHFDDAFIERLRFLAISSYDVVIGYDHVYDVMEEEYNKSH